MIMLCWVVVPTVSTALLVCAVAGAAVSPLFGLAFAVLACMVAVGFHASRESSSVDGANVLTERVLLPGLRAGLGATLAVMALVGICALCGTASLALLTAAAVIALIPIWRGWVRNLLPRPTIRIVISPSLTTPDHPDIEENRDSWRRPHPATVQRGCLTEASVDTSAAPLADMTIDQLCRAWRHSWLEVLDRNGYPGQWEQLAATRRGYLDELERRDPAGFTSWLRSGARAGGDPTKFLTTPPPLHKPHRGEGPPAHHPTDS